ncbi:MAG: hypothetical protein WCD45_00065 [Gallionella sp.]
MPHLTDLTGLLGIASVVTALASRLPRVAALPKKQSAIFLTAVFALLLISFGDMPSAAYARGMVGDLSITSVVLAWFAILQLYRAAPAPSHHRHLLILLAAVAVIFYPMTLGMSLYDPYRLGYSDAPFVTVVLLIAALAWYKKSYLIALCLALAVIAWSMGWYESTNLWDYLLDPLVGVYALVLLMHQGLGKS